MKLTCPVCGAEYHRYPSSRRYAHTYCSRQCAWLAKRTLKGTVSRCEHCGQEFEQPGGRGRRYCSRVCAGMATRPQTAIRNCQQCGAEFRLRGSAFLPDHGKYCSRRCYGLASRKHRVLMGGAPFLPADTDTSACRATEQAEGR